MSGSESWLDGALPRPVPSQRFVDDLLERLLEAHATTADVIVFPGASSGQPPAGLRRIVYVGSAVVGAAAIAIGAAWGIRRRREEPAA